MKNIIATITLLIISAASYANGGDYICGMKRTQQEQVECYNLIQRGGLVRMQKNYERIMASPKIPQNEKDYIDPNHRKWSGETEHRCGNNGSCRYDAISRRNAEIEKYMKGYGLQPI